MSTFHIRRELGAERRAGLERDAEKGLKERGKWSAGRGQESREARARVRGAGERGARATPRVLAACLKIKSGFYEREDVLDAVVGKVLGALRAG